MKIKGSGNLANCILEFNGNEYNLSTVIAKAATANTFDINVNDIDLAHSLKERAAYHEVDGLAPAVIKHAGKFLILLGRDRIAVAIGEKATMVSVRMVTSVALKDAKIREEVPVAETPPPFNPPRWNNDHRYGTNQRTGYQGSNPRPDYNHRTANAGPPPERTRTGDHLRNDVTRPAGSYPNRTQTGARPANKMSYPKKTFG